MIDANQSPSVAAQKHNEPRNIKGNGTNVYRPRFFSLLLWLLFGGISLYLLLHLNSLPQYNDGIFRINGFTILIWLTVSFFSALVSSYSKNYLKGFNYHRPFNWYALGFTLSVMLLVAAEHIALLIISWFLMGLLMSRLIGIQANWEEARQAARFALRFFATGSVLFSLGVLILAFQTDSYTLQQITTGLPSLPFTPLLTAALCIVTAAIIQSAIYPFHRWLLSAMTAPTPASALMHAGFVNGAGLLLTLFASLIAATDTFSVLFIIGGLTAIIAQFTKLLQVNVKQKLACSTIAQMGFMIMQCGLGFFNAAVAHLILHGFYKAYLFLSSGEEIKASKPATQATIKIKPLQAAVVLLFSIAGAFVFAILTGKGTHLDSGIFLTLIVAITVGQATYNIVKEHTLTRLQRLLLSPVLFLGGIILYAAMYNGVTAMMVTMPLANNPLPLGTMQIVFGIIFVIGFFLMKLGIYKQVPWLYVKLLNASQPYKNSVFSSKIKSL